MPNLDLLDDAAQAAVLDDLVAMLDDGAAVQVRHARHALSVDGRRRGAEAELVRELCETASVWRTELHAQPDGVTSGQLAEDIAAEHPSFLELGDARCATTLAITRWPAEIQLGWTETLRQVADAVVLHLRPVPIAVAAGHFRRRVATLVATAAVDQQSGRVADPATAQAVDAAEALWERVQSGATSAWWTQLLVTVVAADRTALTAATDELHRLLAPWRAEARVLVFRQRAAYDATRASGAPLPRPWRLLDVTSAAASIPGPIGPSELTGGVLAGADEASGAPLCVDRFGLHNPARLVVGTSGAGKSYATKLEVCRWRVRGADTIVVDPEGEFSRLGDVLRVLSVGERHAMLPRTQQRLLRGILCVFRSRPLCAQVAHEPRPDL